MKLYIIKYCFLILLLSLPSFASESLNESLNSDSHISYPIYNRESIIKTLTEFRNKNERLGLFIGRTENEPLPDKTDLQTFPEDEGIIWVSASIMPVINWKGGDRLHLQMDLNNDNEASLLKGFFNKIVVDLSTWKFFADSIYSDSVERFSRLLVKDPSSVFIFESRFQLSYRDFNITKPVYGLYTYTLPLFTAYTLAKSKIGKKFDAENASMTWEEKQKRIDEILPTLPYDKRTIEGLKKKPLSVLLSMCNSKILSELCKKEGIPDSDPELAGDHEGKVRENTMNHLEKFFNSVVLIKNGPFYQNNFEKRPTYFIAKDPR